MFFRHRSLLASRSLRLSKAPRRTKQCGLYRSGRLTSDYHTQLGIEHLEDRRMLAVGFQFNAAPGTSLNVIQGFQDAGTLWQSFIEDDVTVVIDIAALDLGGPLGTTSSNRQSFSYSQVRNALLADSTSVEDVQAGSNLSAGPDLDVYINLTDDNPNGSGSATPYVDNDGGANNNTLSMPRANARALGLIAPDAPGSDGSIRFDTINFAFDFDRTDGITPGQTDFVFVAAHEIGHLIGFSSGVGVLDNNDGQGGRPGPFNDNTFDDIRTIDLFRTSPDSLAANADVDFTTDLRTKNFSIDGGTTVLGTFATGVNNGDGDQASHWEDAVTPQGIMDPDAGQGEFGVVTALDLLAFDVIGWDLGIDDRFESNDTIGSATILGSEPEVTVTDVTIGIDDEDFYKYTANDTGKLIVNALFTHDVGDIDLQIQDSAGNVIASSISTDDNETIVIPVVSQEMYFIRVFGFPNFAVNEYTLEIENFEAPAPAFVDLVATSDTGMMNDDNITADATPTLLIQADLVDFRDMGITLLDAAIIDPDSDGDASDATDDGAGVYVSLINLTTGLVTDGFASQLGPSGFLWTFTVPAVSALADADYFVSAAVQMVDGQQDPDRENGRAQLSDPLFITIDSGEAMADMVSAEMLTSSDSGMVNDDNVTNKMQPAFQGIAPAGHKVRLYANGELVGQTVTGSDSSDVGIGGVDGLGGAADDGLGLWEITVEPLADNGYDITLEIEDGAGNVLTFDPQLNGDDEPIDVWIDTAVPNTPLLDLVEASDSGRNDTDNITLDNTPTFLLIGDDTINGDENPFPNDLKYRLYDRPGSGTGEVLIFDSFAVFADFVTFGQISFTSGTLDDGVHDFKLEVEDRAGNISPDFLLTVVFDTVDPPVSFGLPTDNEDGLAGGSDTGVLTMPMTFTDRITSNSTPSFWGRAEADAIVQLFLDTDFNGVIDLGTDVLLGGTVALPFDGNDAFPDGFWEIDSLLDLNSIGGLPQDGLRQILVTAEDVAGNPSVLADAVVDQLEIFLDTQGPQVQNVFLTDFTDYDLFDPKPSTSGFTPLVDRITVKFTDLPVRLQEYLYPAVKEDLATTIGNYQLTGDHVGNILITEILFNDLTQPGGGDDEIITLGLGQGGFIGGMVMTEVTLVLDKFLPDDRYTLTVSDSIRDIAGNALDGESQAGSPFESGEFQDVVFPSGDGVPGGDFRARFTIDSRPEIGSFIAQGINLDINGNFVWDPANAQIGNDATNIDLTFTLPEVTASGALAEGGLSPHDLVFTGKFRPLEANGAAGRLFDQLAAYGNYNGTFRWLIDTDSDGVVTQGSDIVTTQPLLGTFDVQGAIPIAGEFNGNPDDGDEIGLYNQGVWILDSNRDFVIDPADLRIDSGLLGHPIVGDFDGNGVDDLAIFNNNVFSFSMNLGAGPNPTMIWGFPGVLDRPVAADMDQDGIDDIGLWVPRNGPNPPQIVAEWYFLVSNTFDLELQAANYNTVDLLTHGFSPPPFGADLFAEFGDELALPIVGNFDPPVTGQSVPDLDDQNVQEDANFDSDGDVDGFDFLAWQLGFGNTDGGASLADGDANADGAVDDNDLSAWQTQFGSVVQAETSAALLVFEPEVVAPLVVETASADPVSSTDAGQAALARIGGLDTASQQVGSRQAHARVAATDAVFGQWSRNDHSTLRQIHRHRHIHQQTRSHGHAVNSMTNRQHEDARNLALEGEGLEMNPFALERLWRG